MSFDLDLYEHFQSAENKDDLWQKYQQHVAGYGVTSAFYGVVSSAGAFLEQGLIEAGTYLDNHPEEYRNYFDEKFRMEDDLTAVHCMSNTTPFIWHDRKQWGKPTKGQLQFMLDSIEFDMEVGVAIPIRFNQHGGGGIGLSTAGMGNKEFDKQWADHQKDILSASYMFDEIFRSNHIREVFPITETELEVLTHLAYGREPKKIAERLNKSYTTVIQQLQSIRSKLKARNNEQAIVKALVFGLLSP